MKSKILLTLALFIVVMVSVLVTLILSPQFFWGGGMIGSGSLKEMWLVNALTGKCHKIMYRQGFTQIPVGYLVGDEICSEYVVQTRSDPLLCDKYFEEQWVDDCKSKTLQPSVVRYALKQLRDENEFQ